MDRRVIRGPFQSAFDADDGATYHFSACRFEETETRLRREFETPPEGVRFHGCIVEYTETPRTNRKKRELSEINPGW